MMARDTSIESYHKMDLGRKQKAVYYFIKKHGPITRRDLRELMGWPNNEVTPRVKELLDKQIVIERGMKYDEGTKRTVHLLEVLK